MTRAFASTTARATALGALTATLALALLGGHTRARAQCAPTCGAAPLANVLQISAQGSVDVRPDTLRITLSTSKQGSQARSVQTQLNQALEAALRLAQSRAAAGAMNVRTGAQGVYPIRDNKGRISGWQGSAELLLSGTDFERIAAAAGAIDSLSIAQMDFDFSAALREQSQARAQERAIAAFKAQAQSVSRQFGFGSYSLREISVQSGDHWRAQPAALGRAAHMLAEAASAAPPVEAGESTITVVVSGTVDMR